MMKRRILLSEAIAFVAPIVLIGSAAFGGWCYAKSGSSHPWEVEEGVTLAEPQDKSLPDLHSEAGLKVEKALERLVVGPDLTLELPDDSEFLSRTPRDVYFGNHTVSTSVFPTSVKMSVLRDLNKVSEGKFLVNVKRIDQTEIIDFRSSSTEGRITIEMDIDGRTILRVGAKPGHG